MTINTNSPKVQNFSLIEYTDMEAVYKDKVTNSGGYAHLSSAKNNLKSIKNLLTKNFTDVSNFLNSKTEENTPVKDVILSAGYSVSAVIKDSLDIAMHLKAALDQEIDTKPRG